MFPITQLIIGFQNSKFLIFTKSGHHSKHRSLEVLHLLALLLLLLNDYVLDRRAQSDVVPGNIGSGPFYCDKKGTVQRGAKWKEIVDNLMKIEIPKFKVDTRAVRDRYTLLSQKLKRKLREEEQASGIDTQI
jgi:hypothetical protein